MALQWLPRMLRRRLLLRLLKLLLLMLLLMLPLLYLRAQESVWRQAVVLQQHSRRGRYYWPALCVQSRAEESHVININHHKSALDRPTHIKLALLEPFFNVLAIVSADCE